MSEPAVFSLLGPLPTSGRVAIEASAGTGKTYTLAGLVVRYVAEADVSVEELLIVTFTRAAAAELRDRVRSRLSEAASALRCAEDIPATDDLLRFVASTDLELRLDRLERAIADFDATTITTIHGFANHMLANLGSTAHIDPDATLLEDTNELVRAVCADVLAAESVASPTTTEQLPKLDDLAGLAIKVLGNPGIRVIPGTRRCRVHNRRGSTSPPRRPRRRGGPSPTTRCWHALVRRRVDPAPRWAGQPGRGGRRATPVPHRAHRRVPGHRPGAVGHLLEIVRESRRRLGSHPGRRPQASDLLVPWRERVHVPRGRLPVRYDAVHARSEPAFRRGVARRARAALQWSDLRRPPNRVRGGGAVTTSTGTCVSQRPMVPRCRHFGYVSLLMTTSPAPHAAGSTPRMPKPRSHAISRTRFRSCWRRPGSRPEMAPQSRAAFDPSDVAVLIGKRAEAEPIKTALRQRGIPAVVTRGDSVLDSEAAKHWRWLLTALGPANRTNQGPHSRTFVVLRLVGPGARRGRRREAQRGTGPAFQVGQDARGPRDGRALRARLVREWRDRPRACTA